MPRLPEDVVALIIRCLKRPLPRPQHDHDWRELHHDDLAQWMRVNSVFHDIAGSILYEEVVVADLSSFAAGLEGGDVKGENTKRKPKAELLRNTKALHLVYRQHYRPLYQLLLLGEGWWATEDPTIASENTGRLITDTTFRLTTMDCIYTTRALKALTTSTLAADRVTVSAFGRFEHLAHYHAHLRSAYNGDKPDLRFLARRLHETRMTFFGLLDKMLPGHYCQDSCSGLFGVKDIEVNLRHNGPSIVRKWLKSKPTITHHFTPCTRDTTCVQHVENIIAAEPIPRSTVYGNPLPYDQVARSLSIRITNSLKNWKIQDGDHSKVKVYGLTEPYEYVAASGHFHQKITREQARLQRQEEGEFFKFDIDNGYMADTVENEVYQENWRRYMRQFPGGRDVASKVSFESFMDTPMCIACGAD